MTGAPAATAAPPTPPSSGADVTTPTVGRVVRRILVWGLVLLGVIALGVVVVAVTRSDRQSPDYLSATSGSPVGARAVIEVLRHQGVTVTTADSLRDVRAAIDDPGSATLVLFDLQLILGSEQREELLDLADHLVVLEPWQAELDELAPDLTEGSALFGELVDDCELPAADRAGSIDAGGLAYVVEDDPAVTAACFEAGEGEFAIVETVTDGTRVTVVGASRALTNGQVLRAGNAALALNLLGERDELVWYIPTFEDIQGGEVDTPFELTPPWVTPLAVLALLVALAGAFWRGRRVGPLVVENLPVVVRANETMEGRARLYERAAARGHALDALRIGTVSRLALRLGLPRAAEAREVADAAAAITGRDRDAVRALLLGGAPGTDADLVRASDDLLRLEADVARAVRS